jgi:hypothetical protein
LPQEDQGSNPARTLGVGKIIAMLSLISNRYGFHVKVIFIQNCHILNKARDRAKHCRAWVRECKQALLKILQIFANFISF